MNNRILHIKNMVCARCLTSVKNLLEAQNLSYKDVSLGRIELKEEISEEQLSLLESELNKTGFELVIERSDKIVNAIKAIIIEMVYHRSDFGNKKLSEILSERLHYDYSHLTGIFSKAENQSIQSFQNKIKTERIKELLEYDELSIAEIADEMGYGSAAYLSTFFKKETGLKPSEYKQRYTSRNSLDSI
ncbi:helix-turn-helix domain-containing protein [Salegentibacter flavus]|nr:AraC family transcriptional regulator [Salegentibacter flavus]